MSTEGRRGMFPSVPLHCKPLVSLTYPCLHAYTSLRGYQKPYRGQILSSVSCDFCFSVGLWSFFCCSSPLLPSQRLPYSDPNPAAEIPHCTPTAVIPSQTLL